MRKIADMQNRLIAAFGTAAPVETACSPDEGQQKKGGDAVDLVRPDTPETFVSPAWLGFFNRLGGFRHILPNQSARATSEAPVIKSGRTAASPDIAALCEALGEMAVTRAVDGRILSANSVFRLAAGSSAPEGKTLQQLGFQARLQADADLAEPMPGGRDLEINGPDGLRIFWWRDVVAAGSAGTAVLYGFARDVTDERLAREQQEVARLKAEALNVTKSRQLATVVHELRTPLNGILGMGQLLERTPLTPEQQNYSGGIRQAGQALAQLVDDLLDYSTMEAGRFKLNTRAENLRQLIESVVEMLAPRAHEKQLEIGATVASDLPDLHDFDPARLRQVLFNVIGNAVKFTQKGGVLIRAWPEAGSVVISVADTGPGMTAEEQARIFGEFEQAGSAEARSGGTGLGMAISSRIVAEFGGTLSVASKKGRGSVFEIRLPLMPTESTSGRTGRGMDDRLPARTQALLTSRVLLLAPDGPSSTAIVSMIETLGGSCLRLGTQADAERMIVAAADGDARFTDLIVDHRLAGGLSEALRRVGLRRILLVNPEERGGQPQELYDAWLIRPVRERTLIDVLKGRLGARRLASDSALQQPAERDMLPRTGLSIVLAEDDAVSAMLYSTILRRSGHTVTHVSDFPALLAALRSGASPDLVISDMHMPGGDIHEALAVVNAISGTHVPPVIILTGEGRDGLRNQVLAAGAAHVMEKPVAPDALIALVRQFGTAAMRQAS